MNDIKMECASGSLTLHGSEVSDKRIISLGTGLASPIDGASCSLIIEVAEWVNPVTYNHDIPCGEVVTMVIGEGDSKIFIGIETCLMTMKTNEVSEFRLENPDKTKIRVKITLQNFENPKEIFQMDNSEIFEKAKHHKERGVELYKSQGISAAFRRFSKALKFLIMLDKVKHIPHGSSTLQCHCYLNMAACQLKYPTSVDSVISNCSKALMLDDANIKGYVRRGQAFLAKGDYSTAHKDFVKALEIDSENKFTLNLLRKAEIGRRKKSNHCDE